MLHMLSTTDKTQNMIFIQPMTSVEKNLKTRRVRVGIKSLNHGTIYGMYGTAEERKQHYTPSACSERGSVSAIILPYIATSRADHNYSKSYNYYVGEQLALLGLPQLNQKVTPNMLCPEYSLRICADMYLIQNGNWHTVQDDTGNGANSQCTS